jgi:hypothetical protein
MPRMKPNTKRVFLTLIPIGIVFLGTIFEFSLGQRFIANFSSFHDQNSALIIFLAALSMLFSAFAVTKHEIESNVSRISKDTRWLMSFVFVLSILMFAAILAIYGWSAALGRLVGSNESSVYVLITNYYEQPPSSMRSKVCRRVAEVIYQLDKAKICLDRAYSGIQLSAGQRVMVNGKASVFGFQIEQIRSGNN